MASKPKNTQVDSDVGSVIDQAFADFAELGEEMRSWRDGMSENLSGGEKASAVEQAADTLEGLEAPDVPECLTDEAVSYTTQSKRKTPRHMRCSNAVSALDAVVSTCEEYVSKIEEAIAALPDDAEDDTSVDIHDNGFSVSLKEAREYIEEVNSFKDELENQKSEAEGVEFPGMMG